MTAQSSDQELRQRLRQLEDNDARLRAELAAAIAREAALAGISQRINEHPLDIDGTLLAIAEAALKLLDADGARVWLRDGEQFRPTTGAIRESPAAYAQLNTVVDASGDAPPARCVRERRTVAVADLLDRQRPGTRREALAAAGIRSVMAAPLGRVDPIAGALAIARTQVRPFNSNEMATLEAFAAQAAIAIETARAQRELAQRNREVTEALETQTVVAQVLEIIAASPADLDAVLPKLAGAAARLCEADSVVVAHGQRIWKTGVGDILRSPSTRRGVPGARAFATNAPVRFAGPIESWADDYPDSAEMTRAAGLSEAASLAVPLRSDTGPVGVIVVSRITPAFTDRHVAILETFASQALIAIDNARLFNELQDRNREITEALRREEASADILRLISRSPEDLANTLHAIPDAARRLTGMTCYLHLLEAGQFVVRGAAVTADTGYTGEQAEVFVGNPSSFNQTPFAAELLGRHEPSIFQWHDMTETEREHGQRFGVRSGAHIPIWRGETLLGTLAVANTTGEPITPAIVSLMQSFADQALIAIENARLLRELRERNREVTDALDVQKAMADLLNVIAGSATDARPVLEAIIATGVRLCAADGAGARLIKDGELVLSAVYGQVAASGREGAVLSNRTLSIDRGSVSGRAALERRMVFSDDILRDADEFPATAATASLGGQRAFLAAPLMKGDRALGVLTFTRTIPQPYTQQQIALIETFADQAVIAIENARLFDELQATTEQLGEINVELATASKHKSDFMANMSHELRTPLNAIIGYSELLQEEAEDIGEASFVADLGKIGSAARHQLRLINDILDLSKIEAGKMTLNIETFDVAGMVHDVQAVAQPLVEKKGNAFVVDCPADIGTMRADQLRVHQSLLNLLSNAAKFTEGGTVTCASRDTTHRRRTSRSPSATRESA